MKKRFIRLSLVIAAMICLLAVPQAIAAEESEAGFKYTVTNGEATVTGFTGYNTSNAVVPDTLGGYPVTTIGRYAFPGYEPLTAITLPDSVTTIEEGAFSSCIKLSAVEFSANLKQIAASAFEGCSSLAEIALPDSLETIGDKAFLKCGLTTVNIPRNVSEIGSGAFGENKTLTAFTVATANTAYTTVDGALFNKAKTRLLQYPVSKSDTAYTVPNTVTVIDDYAFSNAGALVDITLPAGLKELGAYAFNNCEKLTDMVIPNGVTAIKNDTFSYCYVLSGITLPNGITSIGEHAFSYCYALSEITLPAALTSLGDWAFSDCSALTELVIPHGVTILPSALLAYSGVQKLTIPHSVSQIKQYVLWWDSELTDVYYAGSQEDWNKITMEDNDLLLEATIHYNQNLIPHSLSTVTKNGDTYSVNVSLFNIDEACEVLVSGFQENDLAAVTTKTCSTTDVTVTIEKPVDMIKVFVWDSVRSMSPLGRVEVIPVDAPVTE